MFQFTLSGPPGATVLALDVSVGVGIGGTEIGGVGVAVPAPGCRAGSRDGDEGLELLQPASA